jgi:Ran GTPase-activating protein (RanGAP) involved in mRNA processing and transport/O-acetyl-ADP-ribose deacetylase (regulator of RNase III)
MEVEFVDVAGVALSGTELEDYCRRHGLCHLCAKVRTHKRVFQVLKTNKWQPITVKTKEGDYIVYKGYCVKNGCFTMDQAKRLLGEIEPSIMDKNRPFVPDSVPESSTQTSSTRNDISDDQSISSTGSSRSAGGRLMSKFRPRSFRSASGSSSSSSRRNNNRRTASSPKASVDNSDDQSVASDVSDMSGSSAASGRRRFGLGTWGKSRSQNSVGGGDDKSSSRRNRKGRHDPSSSRSIVNDFNVGDKNQDDDMSLASAMTQDTVVRNSLQQLLTNEKSGTTIDLSVTKLQDSHISELIQSFSVANSLTTLILDKCKLNDNEVEMIAQGLAASTTVVPLNKLSLRSNSIGNRGAQSFTSWLSKNTTLEELDVSKNQIGSRGAVSIVSGLGQNPNTKLRMLNLAHNEIWDLGDGSFFATNKSLQLLSVEGNFIHDEGVSAIAQGLAANKDTKLEKLLLGWNGIGDIGITAVAEMFTVNQSIRTIGLAENEITSSGARAILSALASNTTLRDIAGLYHNQIERKFIVVAIKRLLHAHNEQKAPMPIAEDAGMIIEENTIQEEPSEYLEVQKKTNKKRESAVPSPEADDQGLRWEEKVFAPSEDGASAPGSNTKITSPRSGPKPSSQDGLLMASNPLKTKPAPAAVDTGEVALPPERSYDRMAVIQSAPLAYFNNETSLHHAVPLHDFDHEAQVLRNAVKSAEKVGGQIQVYVETATAERLHTFLSNPASKLLHLSCYGHPDYLAFENGFGYIHTILSDTLNKLVQAGGLGSLQVVFVTSFHARSVGQALVDAGVPHVVCCHHAETFRDRAATEFMLHFYNALAMNRTLKQAFQAAQAALCENHITKRLDRYVMLPETKDTDPYHDVKVFFTESIHPDSPVALEDNDISHELQHIPRLPQHYIGREGDMYEVLEALRVDDVVRVGGPPGSGKKSVSAAVCRYVLQRKSSFLIDQVFWLPPMEGKKPDEDTLYGDLCTAVSMIVNSTEDIWETDAAMECRERIELELEGNRTILAIDGNKFRSAAASQNLEGFLSHLLEVAKIKIILIATSTKQGEVPQEDETIHLGPLDFKSTSLLFGEISRFITATGCPAAQSAEEFAALIVPPSVARMADRSKFSSSRRTDLLNRMGKGIPAQVIHSSARMIAEDFIDLIGMANSPEVQVDSGAALEGEISQWTKQRDHAIKAKNFLRAQDLEKLLEELVGLRSQFPSLAQLMEQEVALKEKLASTLAARQYDKGNGIKRELLALKKLIIQEKRALPEGRRADTADTLSDIQSQVKSIMALADADADADASELDMKPEEQPSSTPTLTPTSSATYSIGTPFRNCWLKIYAGPIHRFDPLPDSGAIVCWANECCDLAKDPFGTKLIEYGGKGLARDIYSLPAISRTPWGSAKCGTGNAVIVGPGAYHKLQVHCVVLAVGPISPQRDEDYATSSEDILHYIEIMSRSCYRSSLVLAKHSQLQAIAFPTLTTKIGGAAYNSTLQLGLRCLVEESRYSDLSNVHLVASSEEEACKLIAMAAKMGLSRV